MNGALFIVAVVLLSVAAAVQIAYLRGMQRSLGGDVSRTLKVVSVANIALLLLVAAGLLAAAVKTGAFGGM